MTLAELKTRNKVILKKTYSHIYVLYASTKEETDELFEEMRKDFIKKDEQLGEQLYDFLHLVNFFGELKDINHHQVKDLIPIERVYDPKGENISETKCYQNHKKVSPYNNIVIHEDKVSSFRCACELIKSTSFIVLKEPKPKDDGTNNS